jgi:hypothetical protein
MCTARRRVLGLLAAAIALPGCSTTTRSISGLAPSASGEPARGRVAPSIRLSLDESLRAEVQATDAVPSGGAVPALSLRLVFEPKVLGYSFDAGQLVLRDGRGGEWRPARASAGRMRYGACEIASGPPDAVNGYVPLARGTCVEVGFEHPVPPGERLELVIVGAAVGQRRLAPTTVALARTEQKSRKADPAFVEILTLPLKILLFPLAMYGGV